ncbi:MAG: polysaccharide biosynthesis tyrosine autokinase [bacterium]
MAIATAKVDFRVYRGILWRRKWVILSGFLLGSAPGVYLALTSAQEFKVRTTVMTRELNIEFGSLKRLAPRVHAIEDLGLLKAKLLSPETLDALVEKTGLMHHPALEARVRKMHKSYPQMTPEEIKTTLLHTELREKILKVIPAENLVHFEATYPDAHSAYLLAKTIADIFIEQARQLENKGLESGLRYSSAQLEVYRKRLEDKEAELRRMRSGSALSKLRSQPLDEDRVVNLRNIGLATINQLELLQRTLSESESKLPESSARISAQGQGGIAKLFARQLDKLAQLAKLLNSNGTSPEQLLLVNGDLKNLDDALLTEVRRLGPSLVPVAVRNAWAVREISRLRLDFLEEKKQAVDKLLEAHAASRENLSRSEPARAIEEERLLAEVQQAQQLYEMFLQQKQGAEMEAALKEEQSPYLYRVIQPAELPLSPVSMSRRTQLLLGCVLGLALGLTLAFAQESLDRSFKSVEEVESFTKLPVVGHIPKLQQPGADFHLEMKDALEIQRVTAYLTEQLTATNGRPGTALNGEEAQATALITSSVVGEGKSTFAAYLASSISLLKRQPVLLIDADLRRPAQHRLFKVENQAGLANLIENHGQAIQAHLVPTEYHRMFVLPSGQTRRSPLELFTARSFASLLAQLQDYFRYIIIDAPPVVPVNDTLMLCKHVNAMLYILKAGETQREVLKRGLEVVRNAGAPAPGIIINNFKDVLPYYYRPQHYKYVSQPVGVE